jgi:hypothetical protein
MYVAQDDYEGKIGMIMAKYHCMLPKPRSHRNPIPDIPISIQNCESFVSDLFLLVNRAELIVRWSTIQGE